jgi:hypothetical protein
LIPLAAAKAVVGSVGQILFALGMTKLQLLAQTIFLFVSLLPILAYVVYTPVFQVAVMLWSLCGLVAYSLFWLLCLYGSHKSSSLAS